MRTYFSNFLCSVRAWRFKSLAPGTHESPQLQRRHEDAPSNAPRARLRSPPQIIIFLKLLDGGTSQLIIIEMGISTAIEGWKVSKILRNRGMWGLGCGGGRPARADALSLALLVPHPLTSGLARLARGRYLLGRGAAPHREMSAAESETDAADARAMRTLSYLLYPAVVGLGVWSLVYHEHRSWWSWVIQTLAHGVYLWGFIAMTPQLYINYRLKSVAHLPWRVMMYKVFNTFVDDVFAFAIEMPWSHRLACFRDDVIFFIFLYQRYLYPVDKTRPNEFGRAYEEKEGKGAGAAPKAIEEPGAAAEARGAGRDEGAAGADAAKGDGDGGGDGAGLRQRKGAAAGAEAGAAGGASSQ